MQHRLAALSALCALALAACDNNDAPKPDNPRAAEPAPGKLELIAARDGDLAEIVRAESERARSDGKVLLVYVGAKWCEPCQRFHEAAARGELDKTFPRLRLLELDYDRDEQRLIATGCRSRLIPLFAKPDASGRCSDQRMEGSIKGEGAVAEITPRLLDLLR